VAQIFKRRGYLSRVNFWNNFNKESLIAAHRGYSSNYPENTLLAFKEASTLCDFIELDVSYSKDRELVVIHDDTLKRTTNAQNIPHFKEPYTVMDYTLDELKELDASSWFLKSDPFKTLAKEPILKAKLKSISPQKIPTLKEVLEFAKRENTLLNIEIKDIKNSKLAPFITKDIKNLVNEYGLINRVLISSFNHNYLFELKKIEPKISTAALQEYNHPKNLKSYLNSLGVSAYNIEPTLVDKELIDELKRENIVTNIYTVDNKKEQEKLYSMGVKSIFTNRLI